ncbi:hypothetical protein RYX36_032126 [Vicia faba]
MAIILQLAFQSLGIVYGDIGTSPLYVFSSVFPDGGTFALYSLICRYAKVGLIPNQQQEDAEVSNYKLQLPNNREKRASKLKSILENSHFMKIFLLFITLLGTSMVIGDGVLTPCISDQIVLISVAILIGLFMVQRFGTDKVGYSFAPIISIWFALIAVIGLYNFIKHDASVIKALNPKYIVDYFIRNKKGAWISLGGVVLCTTGTEALFADVGHFTVRSIQISMCCVTYPALILAYAGQASFLRKNNDLVSATFYKSVPGIAVVSVMTLTSAFLTLIMIVIWKTHMLLIISYVLIIGSVELVYLSSVLYKFDQGGYLPLAFSAILMFIMYVWNTVYRRKYFYELDHKISSEKFREVACDTSLCRFPSLAMFYSELVQGIPPIFKHYVANVPALHSVLVFVSIKSLPISKVPIGERFLFRRVQPKEFNVFRCVVRYGYTDVRNEKEPFENLMVERLKEFIVREYYWSQKTIPDGETDENLNVDKSQEISDEERVQEAIEKEIETIEKASRAGVVHLIGENEVIASKGAGFGKRILIDYAYNFLKKNLRQSEKLFDIPHKRMVKVGMTYEL